MLIPDKEQMHRNALALIGAPAKRREMTDTDRRDVINHVMHFGASAVIHKRGRYWFIDFGGFGFPTAFKTKREAIERVSLWVRMLAQKRREDEIAASGEKQQWLK